MALAVRVLALLALAGLTAGLAGGFLGRVHPAFDSLAHFRHHFAAATVLAALVVLLFGGLFGTAVAIAALCLALFAGATVLPYLAALPGARAAEAGPRQYTLLQMNLRFDARTEPARALIDDIAPDLILMQEVSQQWRPMLEDLAARYPHQGLCRGQTRVGSVAILSRHPFRRGGGACKSRPGFVQRVVDLDGCRVGVVSQHLHWPWPYRQWQSLAALEPILAGTPKPLIVTGDFNAAAWSAAVTRYARLAGATVVKGIGATWPNGTAPAFMLKLAGLTIDNVLVGGLTVLEARTLAPTASDHLPILVRFAVPAHTAC